MVDHVDIDFNLYYLSYHLHIDIDEIYNWPYEKVFKWMIALSRIQREEAENMSKMFGGEAEEEHIRYKLKGFAPKVL